MISMISKAHGLRILHRRTLSLKNNHVSVSSRLFSTSTDTTKSSENKATLSILQDGVTEALAKIYGDSPSDYNPMVFLGKTDFGDYQCNAAMPLAKKLKQKPRDIAEALISQLQLDGVIEKTDISGPGFINFHLSQDFMVNKLSKMMAGSLTSGGRRLAIPLAKNTQRIVVDFSSPNIAKEMHVGHLRSTIIGDSLCRVLEFLGHDVLRLNHVGDWGTQFGMLIHYLKVNYPEEIKAVEASENEGTEVQLGIDIGDLVEFYKAAKVCFDKDPDFQTAARKEVVALQAGSKTSLAVWKAICAKSRTEFQQIYDRLGVTLEERGESFYNPQLPDLVKMLKEGGSAKETEGALGVFLPGYTNAEGDPLPLMIQKSDGGFLYATTDLAAVQHRVNVEKAKRLIYVTDSGQGQHFQMVFDAARAAHLLPAEDSPDSVELKHVPFGLVMGEDGKKIKSRAGDSVKLRELLDEAVKITEEQFLMRYNETSSDGTASLSPEWTERARILGIAAIKYADLSMNRESNYRFSFDKMLSLSGNTAPYMLYAYVRIQGIERNTAKALETMTKTSNETTEESLNNLRNSLKTLKSTEFSLTTNEEVTLAKQIIRFDEIINDVARELYPNKICDYLFELSQKFNQFYEHCPVAQAPTKEILLSRAALCFLSSEVLKVGLDLLGIQTVDKL